MSNQPTRREMLQCGAAIGAAAFGVRAAHAAPAAIVHEIKTISHQPDLYHGWATMARRKNGELLLVCSGGREAHVCPFGRVELMRSSDEGQTWSWPRVVMDSPIDDRDAGVLETAAGSILITTFTSLAYADRYLSKAGVTDKWPADRLRRWRAAHERINEQQRRNELGQWMVRSTDGGVTFSARYSCIVDSPHGPIQLSDGRLLYAGKELWTGGRNGVCESTDDGASWRWLAPIPTRDGDDPAQYHELHAVETTSGRIIVQIRNHNKTDLHNTLQCESDDGGKTWSTPHSIGVYGFPSHLLRLRDGRLIMSYGYRRKPFGNQARISEDGGNRWSGPMTISDDGAGGDLGYPSTVELADGSLLSVWYEKPADSSFAQLRQARWTLN